MDRRGLIEVALEGEYTFKLTQKGEALIGFIKKEFQEEQKEEVHTDNFMSVAHLLDEPNWIQEYIDLFPLKLQDHIDGITDKMNKFQEEYKYSKDTILAATRAYMKNQEDSESGFKYCRRSIYFIWKQNPDKSKTSDLAAWCAMELKGDKETSFNTSILDIT